MRCLAVAVERCAGNLVHPFAPGSNLSADHSALLTLPRSKLGRPTEPALVVAGRRMDKLLVVNLCKHGKKLAILKAPHLLLRKGQLDRPGDEILHPCNVCAGRL